jgi:hypothetical protein
MAWVGVPELSVTPSPQRYTHLRTEPERAVRFESFDDAGNRSFVAELTYDSDGLVIDYPQIGTRVPGA